MYCVIQEIQRKKPNACGACCELEAYSPFSIDGKGPVYGYRYTGERFDRPIRTAYKISVHESKRINGVVTKKQYTVTTVGYYEIAGRWFALGDYDRKIDMIAAGLNVDASAVYDLIYAKLAPLEKRIEAEYRKTEEYKTHVRNEKIIKKYQSKKQAFSKAYGVDAGEYDYCYNVFGEVMNQSYLDKIIQADRQRQQAYRSYRESSSSNYSGYDYSSLFGTAEAGYSDDEKVHLKKFYRTLSKAYHPDVNQGADTTAEMTLLNKLKETWRI